MQNLTQYFFTSETFGFLGLLLASLALLLGKGVVRRRRVALAAYHAYNIVEEVASECRRAGREFPFITKAAAGLKYADEWMRANGWRQLKPHEQEQAELAFKSRHGEHKAAQPRGAAGLLVLALVLPLASLLGGCAGLHRHPAPPRQLVSPCEAWRAAELAWSAVDMYTRQALAAERIQACALPPTAPPPSP